MTRLNNSIMGYRPQAVPRPYDSKRAEKKYQEERNIHGKRATDKVLNLLRGISLSVSRYRLWLFSVFLLVSMALMDIVTDIPFTYLFKEIQQKQLHLEHEQETFAHGKDDYRNRRELHDLQIKMAEYQRKSGEMLLDNGFYTNAEETFTAALALDDTNLEAQIGRFKAETFKLAMSGKHDPVVIHQRVKAVLAYDPEDSHAHTILGNLLIPIDTKAAETHYRHALTTNPNAAYTRLGLAEILIRRKDYQQARTLLEEAVELVPLRVLYHNNLAYVLTRLEDFQGAATHYQRILSLDREHILSHFELANALRMAGDPRGAHTHHKSGIALLEHKEVANLPKNLASWYLPATYSSVIPAAGYTTMARYTVRLDRHDQKYVYGQLELAATELLLGQEKKARGRIRNLPTLPTKEQLAIQRLIVRELQDLEKKQKNLKGNTKKFLNALTGRP
uniref:Tetratricopeptide repeat-containing protein n=1 Tax=Candidatus Kentrum sp. FW TaxID=2126338 RepID=A0A450SAB8_9GAMM|nr:MAG: Tetratricopeptide repeat-containing protein [Candidatus Kentron sp. FW]